ncbi:leucine-rich repeat-containing protein 66 [Orycteropus afer afer]|uniref:Leucine-rich repeat-containing protein 66 n=1 Tax=Orycteropus afer afer TaxID=1230840 RepID=A0A8B7B1Y3_ORYAF|nr:leucine-rich repeat-containing protein 66 [Orycteropus afer afer]
MKNLHFSVIIMVIGLCFTGTMAKTRKTNILLNSECQWNGYLLPNCSFSRKHAMHVDTSQASVTVDASLNFFRLLLQSATKKEEWKIKHLDLSNNLIPKITLSTLTSLEGLEILNLSNNAMHFISLDLPGLKSSWVKHHRSRYGLPFLKVLILQRNKLSDTPKGLWKLKSLQSLDLSFNQISQIGLTDFHNCLQLENLYLKNNKIFRIHPEAFKNLKKLQAVDLSSNALTIVQPMMVIALELPHLEVDLADNQWQCDYSIAIFQNFVSKSWKAKWNDLCNKSVGNEEAFWWTPKSRISRETHLPYINLSHREKLLTSQAVRPQEGMSVSFSTSKKKAHVSSDISEKQRRLPRWVSDALDIQTLGRNEGTSHDLNLAVCLSVFITFLVAFSLGALTRPCIDRLWQRRCQNKSPGSKNTYSNEGFYDEIEPAGNMQPPATFLHQAFQDLNLYENQDSFSVMPSPHAAVTHDRALGSSSQGPGSLQSTTRCRNNTGAGDRNDNLVPSNSAACSILHGRSNANSNNPIPAAQDHIYRNDIVRELNYETVPQEGSLSENSVSVIPGTGQLQTVSGPIFNDANELNPSLSREMTTSLSKMLTHSSAWRTGENEERGSAEQLPSGIPGSQLEFSKEMQMNTYANLLSTWQPKLKGTSPEEEPSVYYSPVTRSDPGGMDPSIFPPGLGSVLDAHKESLQRCVPSDTQSELEIEFDSDEGSLFTLSSESSEGTRNVTEEDAHGEETSRASEPLENENSGGRIDNMRSLESLEDITFQNILGKCAHQEHYFEKPPVSGPDSDLHETHEESASNNNIYEDPLTLPRSLSDSPISVEIPGMFVYDYVIAPQPETAKWHCSLRDLKFSNVDILPQTPPCSAAVPSHPDQCACHESESDICKYEPFFQGIDPVQKDSPLKIITGENLRPSQKNSEGHDMESNPMENEANEEFICPLEEDDSTKVRSQTHLLQSYGDEPALQCEKGGGEYFEYCSKYQGPLFQELPNKTNSLRTQEHVGDRDWGEFSEDNQLQLEKDDSNFYSQMQTQSNEMEVGSLSEEQLYYDKDKDVQLDSPR